MSEQQQVTEEQFVLGQRIESLARQNAQQALRIADLEAQIALIQAKSQPPLKDDAQVGQRDEEVLEH
jgi:hypothetical protein